MRQNLSPQKGFIRFNYNKKFNWSGNQVLNLVGGPREIRTPGPLIRSQVLYPAELWARSKTYKLAVYLALARG